MSESTASDKSVSRRRFLKFAALAASAAAVAPTLEACSNQPAAPSGSAPSTGAPAQAAPTAARVVPGQPGAAAPAPAAAGAKTLTRMQENSFIKAWDDYFTQTLIPQYKQETGVDVKFDGISVGGTQAKITAAVETNAGDDVATMSLNWPQLYDEKLVDLTDIADDLGKKMGGWYDNVKDAVVVNGKWKAIPIGNIGQMMVYRTDWFKEAGYDQFPETWDELLEAGIKLKARGHPFGFELGHGFGDNHGWLYPLLWSFGGREVDKDGKKVVLDSDETARSVDFVRKFFEQTMVQDVLGWTDPNNNKAFFGEQISCTNNASSILTAAKTDFPNIAPVVGHALNPKGPSGERFSLLNCWATSIFTFSPNVDEAKKFVQWLHDDKQFRPWLAAGDAYYAPFLHGYDNHPMWENDPRMKPYKDSVGTSHLPGWPGPSGRAASENLAKYVITDMYASAAQGKSTKEVIATAVSQLKQIYGAS